MSNACTRLGLSLILTGTMAVAATVPVHVHVVDAGTKAPVPARVYLWRDGLAILPTGFQTYERRSEQHFLVRGNFTLELEPGEYRLRLERGLEYLPVETRFRVERESTQSFTLRKWIDMNHQGWYSADMHVHRDPGEMEFILLAEDLNFAPTITTHVWGQNVRNRWPARRELPIQVDDKHFYTANSQEIERIQGGPGAVILLAPALPLAYSGYEFYPPNAVFTRQAHAQGGYVEADKPFWLDTFVNAALGEIDFIELNCNHFLPQDVDTDLAHWSHWPLALGYRGDRGFALWMMDLYYRILNAGLRLPLSAGSASGVKATPVGYNRVYVRLEKLSYAAFLQAMKEGKSFTTNGPILDLRVNGDSAPGRTMDLSGGQTFELSLSARSRRAIDSMQLIINGKVWRSYSGRGQRELSVQESIHLERSSWIALRAFEPSQQTVVFGHTSPLYVRVAGRPIRVPSAARDLMNRIDQLIEYTKRAEGFTDESHRQETLELYRKARAVYAARAGN